ncbi:MAG: transposase [Proteobacteria bacterium]|nr:transposase [Pseudomonadota bacterium]
MKNYRLPDVQVVTKTQLHRNFSEDQKLQIVKEAFASGMSIAAYSREVDIAANVLFKWRKRFVDAGKLPPLPNWEPKGLSPNPAENGFIQIGNATPTPTAIRITVGSDIVIEYPLTADPGQLAKLIRSLKCNLPNAPGGVPRTRWRHLNPPDFEDPLHIDKES